jgi:DUF1009 family protein
MSSAAAATDETPLGIICGGGSVPLAVAEAVLRRGRKVVLLPLIGWADPKAIERFPHHWIHLGQFGRVCRLARAAGCRDIVFIGTLIRPSMWKCRVDWKTLRILPQLIRAFRGGDDHLLTSIGRLFEDEGFRLLGAHEVAPEILVAEGALGSRKPSERDQEDIRRGLAVLAAAGPFDIGQGVVVANGHVIALEAIEGTDQMLARVAELRRNGRLRAPPGAGVLIKAPKSGQDLRFDMPAIGPPTVEGVAQAGLAGIAIVAGGTVMAEPQRVAELADRAGVFVTGIASATTASGNSAP